MERDPTGRAPGDPGAKLDAGKAPIITGMLRQFPRAVAEVARLSEYGARKYSPGGWKTIPDGIHRYADARGRHDAAIGRGEDYDLDSRILHRTAVAWNALAELELYLTLTEDPHGDPGLSE